MPAKKQPTNGAGGGRSRDNGGEKETFGCPYPGCGQSYSRMEYLKRHQRKHQDDRPFACKDCSKAFARSDVLLRHRRRCHPTPPPPDVSSHSPPQMHRGYPGVPVSSSRNETESDTRAMSPFRAGKRQASAGNLDQPSSSRRRLDDDEEDDGHDEMVNNSRLYDGPVPKGNGTFYGTPNGLLNANSSTYTPHLLPMFQQSVGQHDSNHLEDASVLLSMAYGANGSNENVPTVQGQRVVADDWAPNSTVGISGSSGNSDRVPSISSGTSSNQSPTVGEGDDPWKYLGWMGPVPPTSSNGTKSQDTLFKPTSPWGNNDPNRPISPFLTTMFSPGAFGGSPLPGTGQKSNDQSDATNAAVLQILDELAKYDVPQSQTNMNPERPLLRLDHNELYKRAGGEIFDSNSKFYLPAERFAGCYQIPHWSLPPLRTLSVMANRTFDTVLKHFSMVHIPTFRLIDTAACLAFAICTVGGIRSKADGWTRLLEGISPESAINESIDGPLPPGQGWQSMFERNYGSSDQFDVDSKNVEEWESAHIVRNEKSNMLVKSFSLAKGVLMTEYNVALLQALVLYNAPYFLSEAETERTLANMFLGTIVNIARQIGFFTQELEHFEVEVQKPPEPWTRGELDLYWRRWIQLESRRRTAFLIYHLDIVSALEANIPPILTSCELSFMPLPAPDTLWQATNAEDWFEALKKYKYMTLDEAMRRTFYLPTYGSFDKLHERADTKYYNLLNTMELGPFARTAIISTLLRGVIDIGEGKRDRGDWRDLTDLWVNCSWLRPGKKMLDSTGKDLGEVSRESLRERFEKGLERWRQGWDFDPLCPNPIVSAQSTPSNVSIDPSIPTISTQRDSSSLNYVEEGLPFYWFATCLLGTLKAAPPHEPGWNAFASSVKENRPGINYGESLKKARRFTRTGEGLGLMPAQGGHGVLAPNNYNSSGGGIRSFSISSSTSPSSGASLNSAVSAPPGKIGVGSSANATGGGLPAGNVMNGQPEGNANAGASGDGNGNGNVEIDPFEAFGGLDAILAN